MNSNSTTVFLFDLLGVYRKNWLLVLLNIIDQTSTRIFTDQTHEKCLSILNLNYRNHKLQTSNDAKKYFEKW